MRQQELRADSSDWPSALASCHLHQQVPTVAMEKCLLSTHPPVSLRRLCFHPTTSIFIYSTGRETASNCEPPSCPGHSGLVQASHCSMPPPVPGPNPRPKPPNQVLDPNPRPKPPVPPLCLRAKQVPTTPPAGTPQPRFAHNIQDPGMPCWW